MAYLKKAPEAFKELQKEVKTQEEWESVLEHKGLLVVDVFAGWCGPCKAIVNTFRKIKNETGDDLLSFAIANTDNIESLVDYRGKSQPTFLFYGDGQLVYAVRDCNGPLLIKSIGRLLKTEHEILEGNAEREIFIDEEVVSKPNENEKEDSEKNELDEEEEELVDVPKEVAVAIIKPDAVKAGLVDQIIEEIKNAGLEVLRTEERVLTREEAAEFYKQHEGTDHFEQLIDFMSSGPCMTIAVTKPGEDIGKDLIPEIRSLIGPADVNMAKEEAPESLRAKFGTDSLQNALHSCDSGESAARELAFFFPDFNRPVVTEKRKKKRLQRTLALIRPNALRNRRESIIQSIEEAGFLIAMQKEVQLTREQVEEFYTEHKGQDYFENLVSSMTSGPSLALCLAREDAVKTWRDMLGPKVIPNTPPVERIEEEKSEEEETKKEEEVNETDLQHSSKTSEEEEKKEEEEDKEVESTEEGDQTEEGDRTKTPARKPSKISLRVKFADPDDDINPLHGAESEDQVDREMKILFPMETTVAVIKPDVYEKEDEREAIIRKIKESGFTISAQKEVNLTKELASVFYKEHDGKEFFNKLTDYMSSGPTQFLILSREDAVHGFRTLMGPAKPEEAKEVDPNSLRAQFAKDELMNAIHGTSSKTKAVEIISEFFPDVQLDENGLVIESKSENPSAEDGAILETAEGGGEAPESVPDSGVEATSEAAKEAEDSASTAKTENVSPIGNGVTASSEDQEAIGTSDAEQSAPEGEVTKNAEKTDTDATPRTEASDSSATAVASADEVGTSLPAGTPPPDKTSATPEDIQAEASTDDASNDKQESKKTGDTSQVDSTAPEVESQIENSETPGEESRTESTSEDKDATTADESSRESTQVSEEDKTGTEVSVTETSATENTAAETTADETTTSDETTTDAETSREPTEIKSGPETTEGSDTT